MPVVHCLRPRLNSTRGNLSPRKGENNTGMSDRDDQNLPLFDMQTPESLITTPLLQLTHCLWCAHAYPSTDTHTHKAFTKLHWLPDLLFKTLPPPRHFEIKAVSASLASCQIPALAWAATRAVSLQQWKAQAVPAEQGLMGADRSTVVKVINTTEILKQHKPQY